MWWADRRRAPNNLLSPTTTHAWEAQAKGIARCLFGLVGQKRWILLTFFFFPLLVPALHPQRFSPPVPGASPAFSYSPGLPPSVICVLTVYLVIAEPSLSPFAPPLPRHILLVPLPIDYHQWPIRVVSGQLAALIVLPPTWIAYRRAPVPNSNTSSIFPHSRNPLQGAVQRTRQARRPSLFALNATTSERPLSCPLQEHSGFPSCLYPTSYTIATFAKPCGINYTPPWRPTEKPKLTPRRSVT